MTRYVLMWTCAGDCWRIVVRGMADLPCGIVVEGQDHETMLYLTALLNCGLSVEEGVELLGANAEPGRRSS